MADSRPRSLSLMVSVALAVGFVLLAWRAARNGLPRFDEAFLLYGLERVRDGALPIADFQSYDVGRYYLLQPFEWLAGIQGVFAGGHALMAGAVVVLVAVCRPALGRRWQPVAAGLLTTILLIWGSFPRHKALDQAALLLVTAAFVHLFLTRDRRAWFVAGLTTGFAAVVGRNHGAYALVALALSALLLAASHRAASDGVDETGEVGLGLRDAAAGVVIGWSPTALLLLLHDGFRRAYLELLVRDVGSGTNIPLPTPWPWSPQGSLLAPASLGFMLVPFASATVLVVVVLRRRELVDDTRLAVLAGAAVVGLPYLHHAFSRADLSHLAQAIAPAIVIAVVLLMSAVTMWTPLASVPTGVVALVILGFLSTGPLTAWPPFQFMHEFNRELRGVSGPLQVEVEVEGERRRLGAADIRYLQLIEALSERIPEEDVVLALPREVGVYLYTDRVAPIPQTYLTGNTNETEQREMAELVESVDWLVLNPQAYGRNPMTEFATAYPLVWEVLDTRCQEVLPTLVEDQPYEVRRCRD